MCQIINALPKESIKTPPTSDNTCAPKVIDSNRLEKVIFNRYCLIQDKIYFIHGRKKNKIMLIKAKDSEIESDPVSLDNISKDLQLITRKKWICKNVWMVFLLIIILLI